MAWLRRAWGHLADLGKIAAGEFLELLVQAALPAVLLLVIAFAGRGEDAERQFLRFDPAHLIGTPLTAAEELERGNEPIPSPSIVRVLADPRLWRNRWAYLFPSLCETSLLLGSGLLAAGALAMLLVVPSLRAQSSGVKWIVRVLDEFSLLVCSIPVFAAGFVIRLKVPHDRRALYYCLAALTLGIGNLTLAEMVQMLRSRLEEETSQPYFELTEVRGFTWWRTFVHRVKPYARALILSLRSKVPILFSAVVSIEIILSLPVGGRSPIEKGLGLVAKEAAEAGDGITLLAVIIGVALWIRVFSLLANSITYFFLWNPKQSEA